MHPLKTESVNNTAAPYLFYFLLPCLSNLSDSWTFVSSIYVCVCNINGEVILGAILERRIKHSLVTLVKKKERKKKEEKKENSTAQHSV